MSADREDRLTHVASLAVAEQVAAEVLRDSGKFPFLADDDDCPDVLRLAALMEEVGEVARELHDGRNSVRVRAELLQVAGVAIAWASVV